MQALALGERHEGGGLGDLALGGVFVPLGVVVAQDQPRADLEVRIRLLREEGERLVGVALGSLSGSIRIAFTACSIRRAAGVSRRRLRGRLIPAAGKQLPATVRAIRGDV